MRVKVLYFGVLRDLPGEAVEMVEMADGASVGDLLRLLRGRTSNASMAASIGDDAMDRLWRSLAVAVNREYATASMVLCDEDEVALLPPVSGGRRL
jgi:molybdopterin converting factor small subunit